MVNTHVSVSDCLLYFFFFKHKEKSGGSFYIIDSESLTLASFSSEDGFSDALGPFYHC
jgi:hypothetical protein